jgi:hypothetical protein
MSDNDDLNEIPLAKLIEQNISLVGEEAKCLLKDWQTLIDTGNDDDSRCEALFRACKHLQSLTNNISMTYKAVLDHVAPPELLMELMRQRLEQETGGPVAVDEFDFGGMVAYGFRSEEIVVPDDCAEIDGEEE